MRLRAPLCVAAASLLIAAAAAGAATAAPLVSRTWECSITGTGQESPVEKECTGLTVPLPPNNTFGDIWGSTGDGNRNVWVADALYGQIYKFDSEGYATASITSGSRSLAYALSSDRLYAADSSGPGVTVYSSSGALIEHQVLAMPGNIVAIGIDNSGGPTDGTVYAISTDNHLYKFSASGEPVDFSAEEPYVLKNSLSGAPSAAFRFSVLQAGGIAVDGGGRVFVTDGRKVVDEFDGTGTFVREITEGSHEKFTGAESIAIDPTNEHLLVLDIWNPGNTGPRAIDEFDSTGALVGSVDTSSIEPGVAGGARLKGPDKGMSVDSVGRVYVSAGRVQVFSPVSPPAPTVDYLGSSDETTPSGTIDIHVDPNGGGDIVSCRFEFGETTYGPAQPCSPDPAGSPFSGPTDVSVDVAGLTPETPYHYRFVVGNGTVADRGYDHLFVPHLVAGLTTEAPTNLDANHATLNGSWIGNGNDTEYFFQWGKSTEGYGHVTPLVDAGAASGDVNVAAAISKLEPSTSYHFRIEATNNLGTSFGFDRTFITPPGPPVIAQTRASNVRSDSALLNAIINPAGGNTTYSFEYGPTEAYGSSIPLPAKDVGSVGLTAVPVSARPEDLTPASTYHFRVVATNVTAKVLGPDRVFSTFATPPGGPDPCPNALSRKQTGSRTLLDCRAYELVSAENTASYDVESSLVPGQQPFSGYPLASDPPRVLYAVNAGAIPGLGNPTNRGPDPYVATRGEDGWTTEYVGLPADIDSESGPFSSVLGGADASLDSFVFAGGGLCSPCFASGIRTGIPLRLADGELVQGMSGSLDPGQQAANPEGEIGKYISADGGHLIFGSKYAFEPGANNSGTDLTLYSRDLRGGGTKIISTNTDGTTMTAGALSELDLSSDGSRVAFAKPVSTDFSGNEYVHPYMRLENASGSVDLAPGSTSGVLFGGMTSDGSRVFYTSVDRLLPADTDSSSDLYEAAVDGAGALSLRLVSDSNSDLCNPVSNSAFAHWNSTGPAAGCGAVALGGGGGVTSRSGSVYFLSPEQLDGSDGVANQPNLYLAEPGGEPRFVSTLEPGNPLVVDSVKAAGTRRTGDFQVTPDGSDAVFVSALPLTGVSNVGFLEVFRFDAGTNDIACASCDPTGSEEPEANGDAELAADGLAITDDGRVFFTTPVSLVLNDSDGRGDVYEWTPAGAQLISSGISAFDSGLLSVSADGVDVYFFTHDKLTPQGRDGTQTKIYDARTDGGFFVVPPPPPCAASDECHGAGTEAPGPPQIKSAVPGTTGNLGPTHCRKGSIKKNGKCVKKKQHKRAKRKAHKNA
jgi:hypothetical protein